MLNGINSSSPMSAVQPSHQANDGGAGNLGYFQQEKKKKKDEQDEGDTLELSSKKETEEEKEPEEKNKKPDDAGSKIRTFWFKIHGIFNEAVTENNKT